MDWENIKTYKNKENIFKKKRKKIPVDVISKGQWWGRERDLTDYIWKYI